MSLHSTNLNRRGISLIEILIGIMVLGIGVISLATIFPIGLLKMKRAVNEVRGTVVARSALSETRVRNLVAPPFGPTAAYFSGYPPPWPQQDPSLAYPASAYHPTVGQGVPVIIDPLWMIQAQPGSYEDRFGFADFDSNGTADFTAGEGLLRVRGGPTGAVFANELELMSEVFSSPDDLAYGDNEARVLPFQPLVNPAGPPYLSPTNGTPFAPASTGYGLARERRYTWMIVARKVSARQVYHPGSNGTVGTPLAEVTGPIADILENVGPDLFPGTLDDPGRNMLTAVPEPAPIGPFHVTIVAFYSRDFGTREAVFANQGSPPPVIFTKDSEIAVLVKRTDVPFPNIPLHSYIMDTTFDSASSVRNGFVYRVISRTTDNATGNLILTLDEKARENGRVLTVLKGAVGVFSKQVP